MGMKRNKNRPRVVTHHRRNTGLKANDHLVMGRNCLRELLQHDPKRIIKVWVATGSGGADKMALLEEIRTRGISYEEVSAEELSCLVQSDSHQSFVASIVERPQRDIKSFIKDSEENSGGLVLALDSIMDPQNLGALLRAAECFGVDAVIWSKNRGCSSTPVVSKASAGASELVDCYSISNLAETLRQLKQAGYWIVVADVGEGTVSLNDFDAPAKLVLVLGSEGSGVQPLVKKLSDFRVRIPQSGRIDSLNVSQAGAVLLYCLAGRSNSEKKTEK